MSPVTNSGDDNRPDDRAATPETAALRVATRALREHLDELPVDYNLNVPGDRFLTGLAFMFARQRYDCADSMIGAGFGGTVLGFMARSLFIDGLRWLWISQDPERRRSLLGDLLMERNHLRIQFETSQLFSEILPRWLMPLPDVADLTGASMTWIDAQPMPTEGELLSNFLVGQGADSPAPSAGDTTIVLLQQARTLLDVAGLRGAAMVLDHAGHGNYLGFLSTLTEDGAAGHDLRADHEALFMHVAAVGVTLTLLGAAATVPEQWPSDVEQGPFLQRAVALTEDVAEAAVAVHRLRTSRRSVEQARATGQPQESGLLRGSAVLTPEDLLPDVNTADPVIAAAEAYYTVVRSVMVNPWERGDPLLHAILAYGGGHSTLDAVMSTCEQPGSEVIAVFAARMLLEEAARLLWRFSLSDPEKFKARAKQYFDEYRFRRRKAINALIGGGVPQADAQRIFALPGNVRIETPLDEISRGRTPLPTISSMLKEMGAAFDEPGWLDAAYSLLSQITHSTPIGHLHVVRVHEGIWSGNTLSPEMLALALDTACLGSAHLIGISTLLLTDMSSEASHYRERLLRAAGDVHDAARMVHFLD
jgi:hypothetical protein